MKSCVRLPEEYSLIRSIDLLKNKKEALTVNMLSLILFVLFFIPGQMYMSVIELFGDTVQLAVFILLQLVYIVAHEAVHGVFMKCCLKESKLKFGYKLIYAYAGSDSYYCKKHYIIIALAPLVILGILLLAVNLILKESFFWPVYFTQLLNISGAAGDIYVFYIMSKMPSDILVNDTGVAMSVYSKNN